jgi:hypothetical protein
MDAWQTLLDTSLLPDAPGNDAWDHLTNQGGGVGGPGENVYILANIGVDAELDQAQTLDLQSAVISGTVGTGDIEVDVEVEDVEPTIDITIDVVDIDNPDEIEV